MNILEPQYYQPIFVYTILFFTILLSYSISKKNNAALLIGNSSSLTHAKVLAFVMILFIGTRPNSGIYFGDMGTYNGIYYRTLSMPLSAIEYKGDWGFLMLIKLFGILKLDYLWFCVFIDLIYIGVALLAFKRLSRNHSYILLIGFMSAFSFFSYGTNGVRNGIACSIIILALTYLTGTKKERIFALLLCLIAYTIHHSTALPGLMMFVSYYFIRGPKWCIFFWILSIVISLTAGSYMESLFAGLGFDEKLTNYIRGNTDSETMGQFSQTGFRWDFLLYSSMPIILGWYIVMRRKITDRQYIVLLNTYILSNAFWIMVIRASFSNRFAYLSWFMYAIVLIYPLIKIPIYNRQGTVLANILLAHVMFTVIMSILGK